MSCMTCGKTHQHFEKSWNIRDVLRDKFSNSHCHVAESISAKENTHIRRQSLFLTVIYLLFMSGFIHQLLENIIYTNVTFNVLPAFLLEMHVKQRAKSVGENCGCAVRKVYLVSKRSWKIKKILRRIEEAKDRRIYENDNPMCYNNN